MLSILKDLFVNLMIIIAVLTLGNLLFRDKVIEHRRKATIWIGILSGILGSLLMLFSVNVAPDIIIDFRCIPILLMGIYLSLPASITASLIIGVFRVAFYGATLTSIIGFATALLLGLICGLIGRANIKMNHKWIFCGMAICVLPAVALVYFLMGSDTFAMVLLAYLIGTALAVIFTFFFMKYITNSNNEYYYTKDAVNRDFLTGLNNIRHFDTSFNEYLAEAKNANHQLSLLFIDIDFFKKVNDTYGHLSGDMVLKEIGQILTKQTRETDFVTRKGGEEFTVLLKNCGASEAYTIAERYRKSIEAHKFVSANKKTIKITVSIGISSFPETTATEDRLTEHADIALYKAKRAGRNRVCFAEKAD